MATLYSSGQVPSRRDSTEVSLQKANESLVKLAKVVTADTSLTGTSTANAAVTVTIAAATNGDCNVLDGIAVSYTGTTPVGSVTVKDGTAIVFVVDINDAVPHFIPVKRKGTANTAMTVILAAGGSGVIGKANVLNTRQEP